MAIPPAERDLLFTYDFPPMGGGIARWMAAIACRYPAGGLTVSTGTRPGSSAVDAALPQQVDRIAVNAERLRTVFGQLAWSRRAVSLARDPAVRFAWADTVRPAGYPAHWAWRRTGLRYGIIMHGGDLLTLRKRIAHHPVKRRVMQSILGGASVYLANSEWTAGRCRALLGEIGLAAAAVRIRVVPLGTNPAVWRRDAGAAAAFCRRRGLPAGRWMVTVARLVPYKGIDTAIRVLARLRPTHPDLHYAVIGRGPDAGRLGALSAELGVADRFHLLTDVEDAELVAAYSIADVYAGLTRETDADVEGFGISFVEASACGVPVVASRSGGIPDAVTENVTGLLFDAEDQLAIAAAVDRVLTEPGLAERLGAAGRERVERYLNWDRVVGEIREIAARLARQ